MTHNFNILNCTYNSSNRMIIISVVDVLIVIATNCNKWMVGFLCLHSFANALYNYCFLTLNCLTKEKNIYKMTTTVIVQHFTLTHTHTYIYTTGLDNLVPGLQLIYFSLQEQWFDLIVSLHSETSKMKEDGFYFPVNIQPISNQHSCLFHSFIPF